MKPTVSLVMLTWNRRRSVEESLTRNLDTADYPIKEIVHVDNGSSRDFVDWFTGTFKPDVQVRHRINMGVATGYNRGLLLATGSHLVITGCDRIMPDKWLATWVDHLEAIPNTGVIACYSGKHPERMRGGPAFHNGRHIQRAIGVEARIHSRELLMRTGLWREDFGSYGYEDSEWSDRAERVAREDSLINYTVDGMEAVHLPDDDFDKAVLPDYKAYKKSEHADPRRAALFKRCHALGSPYYNPYARIEPSLFDPGEELP